VFSLTGCDEIKSNLRGSLALGEHAAQPEGELRIEALTTNDFYEDIHQRDNRFESKSLRFDALGTSGGSDRRRRTRR